MDKLVWEVYIENINKRQIELYNIFKHGGFKADLINIYKEEKDNKDNFLDRVRRSLMYYYWSKCEWEIILSDWPPSKKFNDKKISVYDQIMPNWHVFSEYIWNNRDLIKNFEEV